MSKLPGATADQLSLALSFFAIFTIRMNYFCQSKLQIPILYISQEKVYPENLGY
jgi:hypothetical protein